MLVAPPGRAETVFFAVDVPTTLAGSTWGTHQIVRGEDGVYSLAAQFPEGTEISALERLPDGRWLFAPAHVLTLADTEYGPRDVVVFDGGAYRRHLDGAAAGIPPGARIDAIALDGAGKLVLSFDIPVRIQDTEFGRSDLVRLDGAGFSLHFGAEAAGVPASANLVGAAEESPGVLLLTFDVPVPLGGVDRMPGEIVRWNGAAFESRRIDPGWPPGSQLRDFGVLSAEAEGAGAVPDGHRRPGTPLTLGKAAGGAVALAWGAACAPAGADYVVYEGRIGDFANPSPARCSTAGQTSATLIPAAGGTFYLVVARSASREGSLGLRGDGSERPRGGAACLPQQILPCR